MRLKALAIGCVLASGCSSASPTATTPGDPMRQKMESFCSDWLRSHGHTDVVIDADGVGIDGNPTRLRAALYGSDPQEDGDYIVELEFSVQISPERIITEFVVGTGKTEELAIEDALFSFALTTFHPVYMGFMNPADPHMTEKPLTIGGVQRIVIAGDYFARGGAGTETLDFNVLQPRIEQALQGLSLDAQPHWLKIIYGQSSGEPITVAVTVDNQDHLQLTEALSQLSWPRIDGVYMFIQFIVIK